MRTRPYTSGRVLRPLERVVTTEATSGSDWDAFGSPDTDLALRSQEWTRVVRQVEHLAVPRPVTVNEWVNHGMWDQLVRFCARSMELVEASGRWPGVVIRTPNGIGVNDALSRRLTGLVPGDVALLRCLMGVPVLSVCQGPLLEWVDAKIPDDDFGTRVAVDVGFGWAATSATPFFLPARSAQLLLHASPPDPVFLEGLHLPFRSVLVFFDETPIVGLTEETISLVGSDLRVKFSDFALVGVCLYAPDDGTDGIAPWWSLLMTCTDPDGERGFLLSHGLWARSAFPHLAAGVALAVCAAPHLDPAPAPDGIGQLTGRDLRKVLKKRRYAHAERAGSLAEVRVIDLGAVTTHEPADDQHPSSRRSPRAHWRRGHVRRVRVGARDDWRYEQRWIPPVLVNPSAEPVDDLRVYRLPG